MDLNILCRSSISQIGSLTFLGVLWLLLTPPPVLLAPPASPPAVAPKLWLGFSPDMNTSFGTC